MNLNKKGWSTLEMLLLSGGLLIALLVAVYFIGILYGSLDNAVSNKKYIELENSLENAAIQYVFINNIKAYNNQTISYITLLNEGYISELVDSNGNACSGYVRINIVDEINQFRGFISCPNYQTDNY